MKLEEHTIVSSSGEYSRKAWYFPSEQEPKKICIFLDGEYYVNHMDAPSMITELQDKGLIPPITCLFVSHVNGEARHHDYTCNQRYAQFVAQDLVTWVRDRNSRITDHDHFLGGTSLGGLEAAYASLCYPKIFTSTLCQSGSFWWNKEWLKNQPLNLSTSKGKFWISVGDKETESNAVHPPTGMRQEVDQISATERFVEVLKGQNLDVHYHLYQGGHEIKPWKEEFSTAIQWLLN